MPTTTDARVEERFEVGEGSSLELHTISGSVLVRTHDEPAILLSAVMHGREEEIERTRIETSQDGNRVTVRTEGEKRDGWSRHTESIASVDYDLTVPRDCALDLHAVSAGIDVLGAGSTVSLGTVSGNLILVGGRDSIRLHTVSGSISARDISGDADLNSVSGSITITRAALSRFVVNTVSGSATITTPLTAGEEYTVTTVSGSLHLTVPASTGIDVHLSTLSGRISSSLPITGTRSIGNWTGHINDGGARLTMTSVSGGLFVHADETEGESER